MTPDCTFCAGTGWVCEDHPAASWPDECDCGAGMPCECNPGAEFPPGTVVIWQISDDRKLH